LDTDLLDGQDLKAKGKLMSYQLLESDNDYVVGLIETSRDENIPPHKDRQKGKVKSLNLPEGDGLAYANVFYYDVSRCVILYEVNKSGSVLDHLFEFLYKKLVKYKKKYSVSSFPILKKDQYEKLIKMTKTAIEIEVAHPVKVAKEQEEKYSSMFSVFKRAAELDATKLKVSFSVDARHSTLKDLPANDTITEISEYSKLMGADVEHVRVSGYVNDGVDDKIQKIDLVTDRLTGVIELREPRQAENLLENQRLLQIKTVYDNKLEELKS